MKVFKENTITFGTMGRTNLAIGFATVGMALLSTALCLLMKDQYQFGDGEANEKVGEFRDNCKKAAKKNK